MANKCNNYVSMDVVIEDQNLELTEIKHSLLEIKVKSTIIVYLVGDLIQQTIH